MICCYCGGKRPRGWRKTEPDWTGFQLNGKKSHWICERHTEQDVVDHIKEVQAGKVDARASCVE